MLKFMKKVENMLKNPKIHYGCHKPTTGRMAIKKNRSLKKWVGVD